MATTNYAWNTPTVGGDEDTWGTELNTLAQDIDTQLKAVSDASGARGSIAGLTLSAAGSTATFGIAAGIARDSTNVANLTLGSAYTKTASAWAVGTGNGALDTSTIANSTWYHVWLIKRVDTSVVDVLISLSATAPTMPTNYTLKRRIGSMKTDGSGKWVKFTQVGDEFLWDAPVLDVNITNQSTTAVSRVLSVPTGLKVTAILAGTVGAAGSGAFIVSPTDVADTLPVFQGIGVTFAVGTRGMVPALIRTDTSAQIRTRSSVASTVVDITTMGWLDRRGRDD